MDQIVTKPTETPKICQELKQSNSDAIHLNLPMEPGNSKDQPSAIVPDRVSGKSKQNLLPSMIIDLDEYDDHAKKRPKRASTRCINFECENGENLRVAPNYVLSFYRVKIKYHKIQEACEQCYNLATQYFENLATCLVKGEPLVDLEFQQPLRDEYVEIDSDEDKDIDPSTLPRARDPTRMGAGVTTFLFGNIVDAINNMMNEYRMEYQIDTTFDCLLKRNSKLKDTFDDMDDYCKKLQKDVDFIRKDLYAQFRPNVMELEPIEIIDTHVPKPTTPPTYFQQRSPLSLGERRSNRIINKPASYCELADDLESTESPNGEQPRVQKETDVQVVPSDAEVVNRADLPPKGPVLKPAPVVGEAYYAMRQSVFGAWGRVRLIESVLSAGDPSCMYYKVKLDGKAKGVMKMVNGKQLAYANPAAVRLDVGTRVIAVFMDESTPKKESYFTGVVAEPLSQTNQFRYLVFFDDGYAQYVPHKKVLLVVECSVHIWEDIHPDSRFFIKKYLENYPERPMVKLQSGQIVKTEWNGKWWIARVIRVEGSLVQMYFDADARSEWIYRGSTRLGPLFLEMQAAANRQERGPHIPKIQNAKKNVPYVEYTRSQSSEVPETTTVVTPEVVEANTTITPITTATTTPTATPAPPVTPLPRAVARKSTNRPANTLPVSHTPPPYSTATIVPFLPTPQPQSKVVYFTPKSVIQPKVYEPHECSVLCRDLVETKLESLKGYNPLSKPLLRGWYRQLCRYKGKKIIQYRTPCSRTIRNMSELHRYLRQTGSEMSVDMFDFDFWVHCLAEFVLDKTFCSIRDMSLGVEHVPIPCVNYVDQTFPDFCNYSTKREPMEGVNLNLETEFLCGCDCEDDCADKTKCTCWQMTIREARTLNKRVPDDLIGYTYKRLPEFVTTGIYECNSRCKCKKATCLNRVVQHPLQLKLQLFKTVNRGWGIRCLNDIPQGAFICIYAGSLLTDKMANEGGVNYGDEYLAELDYIEVVERQKEGYESDATDVEDEDDAKMDVNDEDYASDDTTNHISRASTNPITTRSRKRSAPARNCETSASSQKKDVQNKPTSATTGTEDDTVTISDDDENVREPSRFDPCSQTISMEEPYICKFKSVRKMFGEDEVCYIMDAKNTGNIGRFLNHSCSPNVFVQNVFVDTHDVRFPWVAFFAMYYIRAGTELTWNYNYDVGSVPGKVIFCHCGSPECRGRLL